ncbi:SMI1/KNR4 family protein [Streptomyces sp. NPDC057696]|uniref:SMI1/KNR4 family protein n=1 Tax=Streptomyces sp. NPDC057696 TaxID=3346218 RepID=UPI00367E7645
MVRGPGCCASDPASGEQIAALEATLGVELPEAVTTSLRRHNGSTDGGWPTGTLLSCDGILQEVSVWRDLLTSGDFDDLKLRCGRRGA